MAQDKVWQDESVQIMKQVFSEGIEKRDARIAALEAENKKLRIALKPFADIFNGKAIDEKGTYLIPRDAVRNAAEVLKS